MSQGGPCLWRPLPQSSQAPSDRSKHACCSHRGDVFVLGGRDSGALGDFWKYSVVRNEWTELDCSSEAAPEELEEHTMVAHEDFLYVFGGMMDSSFSSCRFPLWMFDIRKQMWVDPGGRTGWVQTPTPSNRKGHSAVVLGSTMMIYGGFVDVRGSSEELWTLHFDSMSWSLPGGPRQTPQGPGPRHGHSAAAFQSSMFVFGGLRGLQEQRDLWRWNNSALMWTCVSTKSGPPRLIGHSAVTYRDGMLIFGGGECRDSPQNCLWKFTFHTQRWSRVSSLPGPRPPGKIHHCCAGIGRGYSPSSVPPAQTGRSPQLGGKHKAFQNRCYPAPAFPQGLEDAIELQPLTSSDAQLISRCLTSENKASRRNGSQEAEEAEEEDFSQHLPDLLLVLGGRPVSHHCPISVWQMTLSDG
ncbi:hypothetical protein OJAV_G00202710 [Oryzias javanicus]|uniref:Uncharacterized protein n=1 Tax=Oryzias javanicus TaxID=123683 RepID=A0A437C505_ORYJA|nr:hypothetical protein OJAV_G00202710 [Oryzias javanicus]